ncbi:MAG: cell division protein ZapA [Caulobacteraceae bacterium]|nr:cell division protein ZapA [Caulobacteraceae bacterium]MBP6689952.1 cell division protein ZapA [Hyphomonadaceae bacterium]
MQSTVKILGEDYAIECAECDTRRLEDLAKVLETRLQGFSGDASAMRRLVLVALGLIDEAQATSAALARARMEIERLTDMLVEAQLQAEPPPEPTDTPDRGRVSALRVAQGRA